MEYQTVFDINNVVTPSRCSLTLGPALITAGGFLLYLRRKAKLYRKFKPGFFIVFGMLWSIAMGKTYEQHRWLQKKFLDGHATEYDGIVSDFVAMPRGKVGVDESFVINGKEFRYSDYTISGCFNNTSLFGGPIREGVHVRLFAVGNCIAKLEILYEDVGTQSSESQNQAGNLP